MVLYQKILALVPVLAAFRTASTSPTDLLVKATSVTSNTSDIIINVDNQVTGTLNATAWSLIYSYPLYIFANFAGNVLRNVSVNELFHQRELASPDSPGVIKPNIDTVYSRVVLDLSKQDLVLTVPNITDRYYVYPVIDPFGNVIAEIGNVNKNKPGKYLIRRADDVLENVGFQLPGNNTKQYEGIVNLPTTHGTMLIRLFVLQNTTADLNIIHTYQNQSSLTALNRTSSRALSPSGNLTSLAPNNTLLGIDTPAKLFNLTAKLAPYNQPIVTADRYRVASILGQAGIYDGHYVAQHGVNLTYASQIANNSITADLANTTHIRQQSNNWVLPIVAYQGNYSTHYAPRAYVAIYGYQEQTVAQTLYPGYENIGFTSVFTLENGTSALFTFSGKPLLDPTGFWSLSFYGADQYLIPNSLDRFEAGDRTTSLVYQDGGYVYGSSANASQDGIFQVLAQPLTTPPPSNWTGNWVPVTSTFSIILRWYVPQDAMTNGTYIYPKYETIDSIV